MKKILLVFVSLLMLSVSMLGQVQWYRTTHFAMRSISASGNWPSWPAWEKSSIPVSIDLTNDVVKIYTSDIQVYKILRDKGTFTENTDGWSSKNVEFEFVDQDDDIGTLKLRYSTKGNQSSSQIYIMFSNIQWVYEVERTR